MAGKTGTTQNYGDAWFVGFVPQLATAVWVGYPDKIVPMTSVHGIKVAGGTFPARMWSNYMMQAVSGIPIQQIETANPEDLGLRPLNEAPPTIPLPTTTVTTLPTTTTSSSIPPGASTTTTSTSIAPSTTTTTRRQQTTTTSTTTAPSTTTTTAAPNEETGDTADP